MPLALILVAAVLIAASLFADWKWRKWIAARKQDHDRNPHHRA